MSKGVVKFSYVLRKNLKAAVVKHPNHHVFVDEYVLNLDAKDDICEMMRELKQCTEVKKHTFTKFFGCHGHRIQ